MSKTSQAGAAQTVKIAGLGASAVLSGLAEATANKGGEEMTQDCQQHELIESWTRCLLCILYCFLHD